jgi:hypothetical protein
MQFAFDWKENHIYMGCALLTAHALLKTKIEIFLKDLEI